GVRLGTPRYMAPEQIRDPRAVDGRADVFALGSVFFEVLTRKPAFPADDALGAIAQILLDEAPDPRRYTPTLPEEVAMLARSLLTRDRAKRPYANRELAEHFQKMAERYRAWNPGELNASHTLGSAPAGLAAPTAAGAPASRYPALVSGTSLPGATSLDPPGPFPMRSQRGSAQLEGPRFVGRVSELQALSAALNTGSRVVLLWGAAGIGKTRLAHAVTVQALGVPAAAEHAGLDGEESPGAPGFRFIDLSQARDKNDLVRLVLAEIGATNIGAEDAERALLRALARGQAGSWLVLDRAEHISAPVQEFVQAALGSSAVRFLVTSRERLRLTECTAIELGPLAVRAKSELRTLLGFDKAATPSTRRDGGGAGPNGEVSEGALLLLSRIAELEPRFVATQRDLYLAELCAAALEGVPLAIELAALRVSILGLEGVVGRLSEQLSLLGGPEQQTAQRRQRTMQDALSASWQLLTSDERELLMQCSVFRGGFTVAAAEAVLAPGPGSSILDVLQALRDKSLLFTPPTRTAADGEPRLFTFAVVREYASAKLAESGRLAELCARHARYYIERFAKFANLDRSEWTRSRLRALEAESENLLAAVEHALSEPARNIRLALEVLLVLEPLIALRGPLPAFSTLLEAAIEAGERCAAELPAALLPHVRRIRARLLATAGQFGPAIQQLELALSESNLDPVARGLCHLELGVVHHLARELPKAKQHYDAALTDLRESAEPKARHGVPVGPKLLRAQARCLGNLGAALHDLGELAAAAEHYAEAIERLEELGEKRERANFLGNLGILDQELGNIERARRHLNQAIALLTEQGDARLCGIALGNLGSLEAELGDWSAAVSCHERALEMLRPLDDRCSEALCLGRLGAAYATLGRHDLAEDYANRAFDRLNLGSSASQSDVQGAGTMNSADLAHGETLHLLGAFLDLEEARSALRQEPGEARAHLRRAEARVHRAESMLVGGIPLRTLSDDTRVSLRVLKPLLACLHEELSRGSAL
ncbi:MAG TPA: tetratricopeptide repeat protein, partial [Polyangiaceae bacterium]|nr:tetratricopeptide repeat protein [Polyangiaceae bacterium]